jgi:hypothetical protein
MLPFVSAAILLRCMSPILARSGHRATSGLSPLSTPNGHHLRAQFARRLGVVTERFILGGEGEGAG